MTSITQEFIKTQLHYCESTGKFTWAVNKGPVFAGDIAGTKGNNGYISVTIKKKKYLGHRLAWLYVHGVWPEGFIDHIDGDKCNNALTNLRVVNAEQNAHNTKNLHSNNTSGYKGVHKRCDKFIAQIHYKGSIKHLGVFNSKEEASTVYNAAKAKYHTI